MNNNINIETICRMTQEELYEDLQTRFPEAICKPGKYILVKGEAPVMMLAHMDTVHQSPVKVICKSEDGDVIMSPQGIGGDDRCGIYALLKTYDRAEVKPWLLFTCDEEIGLIGAYDFAKDYETNKIKSIPVKFLIEIDRKGSNDAVYYDCCNLEFEDYITSFGFRTEWGSYSDISEVAPAIGVAAVNLSSGYYNAHKQHEYIVKSQLERTIKRVLEIVEDSTEKDIPIFKYIEAPKWKGGDYYLSGGNYLDDWYYEGPGIDDLEEEYLEWIMESFCQTDEDRSYIEEALDYYDTFEIMDLIDEGAHPIEIAMSALYEHGQTKEKDAELEKNTIENSAS